MKYVSLIMAVMPFFGCASALIAKNFGVVSFEDSAKPIEYRSVGNIEGKDCMWSVFGYPTGSLPTVRSAFRNAVHQKEQALVPGQAAISNGTPVRALKNATVNSDYFNVWALSRNCIVVTGVGLL
jgi:hypothetical protein